jgi:two-component system chemotaxis response regulator CheY
MSQAKDNSAVTRTVLIVEDADDCATTLEIALSAIRDLEVRHANSAESALQALDSERISVLITDVHLPSMNGLELLSSIRHHPLHSRVPILVISGDADPETPRRALNLGANAYFGKPYSPAAVRQKIEELIHENSM